MTVRDHWRGLVDSYLKQRKSLKGVVLIIDSRHPLKEFDRQMLAYAEAIDLACHVVLTKSDKLSRSEAARTLAVTRAELGADGSADARVSVQLFSATAKVGLDEARDVVMRWLGGTR